MQKKEIECIDCGPGISSDILVDRLVVKDKMAIVPGLENIFNEVIKMRLSSRSKIGDELLNQVKQKYIVPSNEEKDYREALMDEYDRRTTDFL